MVGLLLVGKRVGDPVFDAAVLVEEDRELSELTFAVAAKKEVDVVPAAGVELILDERHPEQELDLRVGHALFELQRHFARHQVALVDIGAIRLQEVGHVVVCVFPNVGDGVAAAQSRCGKKAGGRSQKLSMSNEHKDLE